MNTIFHKIKNLKQGIAVLIDPDKFVHRTDQAIFLEKVNRLEPNFVFVGGSVIAKNDFESCVNNLRDSISCPIVIFPGRYDQVSHRADGILVLSLLSGNNYDYIFGQHLLAAEEIEKSNIETLPTAYILIDGGIESAVQRVTGTDPINQSNKDLVKKTALAAKHLGMTSIYLDAGSGAKTTVHTDIVREAANCGLPLIVGGGIRNIEIIREMHENGANLVVIGNHLETNMHFFESLKNYKLETKLKDSFQTHV